MAANSPGTAGSDPADALCRRVKWRILPFLMVCCVVAFAGRSSMLDQMAATCPNPEAP